MANLTLKPIYLDIEGIFAQLPDGSIVNIGGTTYPSFTVGGKSVALSDATSSVPGDVGITFQKIYDETARHDNVAFKLQAGKNLYINDTTDQNALSIDAETGKVTISNLEVLGGTNIVNTTVTDADFWMLSPSAGTTTALRIEPDAGVIPIVDILTIRKTFGTSPIFRIDKDGNVILTQNLTVGGLINGINLAQVKSTADQHYAGTGSRHTAAQIDIAAISSLAGATTVQTALSTMSDQIATRTFGFEYSQGTPSNKWVVSHGKNTRRVSAVVYDDQWEQVIPGSVKITDENTVTVSFGTAMAGHVMLTIF